MGTESNHNLWGMAEAYQGAGVAKSAAGARGVRDNQLSNSPGAALGSELAATNAGSHRLAFFGMCLFLVMLTLRPQDLYPEVLGTFAYIKAIAILTLIVYVASKLLKGERPFLWPLEMKLIVGIAALGILVSPFAASWKDTYDVLTELFLKIIIIVATMIGLVNSRQRLRTVLSIVITCSAIIAVFTIHSYVLGKFSKGRVTFVDNSLFSNPNDLAMIFALLLPVAVVLGLNSHKLRRALYFIAAVIFGVGTLVTFSRGGFLAMAAGIALLLWKLGRNKQGKQIIGVALLTITLLVVLPGGYGSRLLTIIHTDQDETGSAQERQELLIRAIVVAARHPITGIGMGNFHIYSIREKRAHNSYMETAAELGVLGLVLLLGLLITTWRSLNLVEMETKDQALRDPTALANREIYYLSIGLEAMMMAYAVCSFFSSDQYYWYLYLGVAYAVCLRRVRAAEQTISASASAEPAPEIPASLSRKDESAGVLWQPAPAHAVKLGAPGLTKGSSNRGLLW